MFGRKGGPNWYFFGETQASIWLADNSMSMNCTVKLLRRGVLATAMLHSACGDGSHFLIDFLKHVSKTYPDAPFGLVDSTGDWVISIFFGFGLNECSGFSQLSEATYTAGLTDIRAQLAGQYNFGAYVFPGLEHTTLLDSTTFDTRLAANVKLTDYIAALLNGQVTNVGAQ